MVLVLEGQRDKTVLYMHEESMHVYKANRIYKGTTYVKCVKAQCNGRGKMTGDDVTSTRVIEETKEHTHDPEPLYREVKDLLKRIQRRAADENTDCRLIFQEECNRYAFGQLFFFHLFPFTTFVIKHVFISLQGFS